MCDSGDNIIRKERLLSMREAKESDLQNCCDSQSRKALACYRANLLNDYHAVNFDDKVKKFLYPYVWSKDNMTKQINYLNHLKDPEGSPFCRSWRTYSKAMDKLAVFSLPEATTFRWNVHFQKAYAKVKERHAQSTLRPLKYRSNRDVIDAVSKWDTSAGFTSLVNPNVKHKRDILTENLVDTVNNKIRDAIDRGSFEAYGMIGFRTQGSGEYDLNGNQTHTCKLTTRAIWMEDIYKVIAERKFALPYLNWVKSYKYSGIGMNDNQISKRVHGMMFHNCNWLSLDYSGYDSTIPSWLIRSAFDIVESCFKMDAYDRKLLGVLREDFINKNLITADGVIHYTHGTPSGSGFTTIINCICNEIMTETWADKFGIKVDYNVMGDDNLIMSSQELDIEKIASYLTKNFGVKVNASKSCYGKTSKDDPEYLSRIWTNHGPWRHPNQLLSKLLFPERRRDYKNNPDLTPQIIIYSYILGYEAGMRQLMDVDRFLSDTGITMCKITESKQVLSNLPYNVRVALAA